MSNPQPMFGPALGTGALPVQSTASVPPNAKAEDDRINVGPFILSYPNLVVPRKKMSAKTDDDVQYSCELLVYRSHPKFNEIWNTLWAAVKRASDKKWGNMPTFRNQPVRMTTERPNYAGEQGFFISANSEKAPGLAVGNPPRPPVDAADELYAGCFVYANLRASAFDFTTDNKMRVVGVKWYINAVLKVADGPRLSEERSAEALFADVLPSIEFNLAPQAAAVPAFPNFEQQMMSMPQMPGMHGGLQVPGFPTIPGGM